MFVLGRNRSGTKWLTNQVSSHPEVAAITAPEIGVLESILLEHMQMMFGDLSIDDHYYGFLAAFMHSSYFTCSGLPESVLFERRHTDYLEFFGYFMNRLAEHRGTRFWLQKGSSLLLPRLREAFPDAKFLLMRRTNVLENVSSSIALSGANSSVRSKPLLVARTLASYYAHRGIEQRYLSDPNVMLFTYESMRTDKKRVLRSACEFLGLEFDERMLHDAFPPNTSFKRVNRKEVLTRLDRLAFDVLDPLFSALPGSLVYGLQKRVSRTGPRKGQRVLIEGAFRTFRHDIESGGASAALSRGARPQRG